VPQWVRNAQITNGLHFSEDSFGQNFLEQVANTKKRKKETRLKKIEAALNIAVPQLERLTDERDGFGRPHVEVIYKHWRPDAGKQREDQFSDGTLRLIGLLWTILESEGLLLLEEPELSLHSAIISRLPALMHRIQRPNSQILISTHSTVLLEDKGIGAEEVMMLTPEKEGTRVEIAADIADVKRLLQCGLNVADIVAQQTAPENIEQLELFR
jgi:predicted ATPase